MEKKECVWLLGSGASISCGLDWKEPDDCKRIKNREERAQCIANQLSKEIDYGIRNGKINTESYKKLLSILKDSTNIDENWKHLFLTANWDDLLQKEIDKICPPEKPIKKNHGLETYVFHLNGKIERSKRPEDLSKRSEWIFPDDDEKIRINKIEDPCRLELDLAIRRHLFNLKKRKVFIIAGMSFQCGADKTILSIIDLIHAEIFPTHFDWIIVNPNDSDIGTITEHLKKDFGSQGNILKVCKGFKEWIESDVRELRKIGVLM